MEAFVDGVIAGQLESLHIPGAAVAVVADGKVYFAKGYGYADLEKSRKVDPETTLFRIGSVTKLFTSTAVMQLAEQGKLDLNTDVNTYLKAFKVPATYPEPITLAHLLAHTPGFEDSVIGLFALDPTSLKPLGQLLATEMPARVRPPGQLSVYSNHGMALAGYIVQEVSGLPWEDYIEKNILAPLDMKHTTGRQPVPAALTKDLMTGYRYAGGGFQPQGCEFVPISAAGSMSASATDMARFMIAHLQNGRYGENRILSEATARTMHSRLFTNAPGVSPMLHGFVEGTLNGERTIWHNGGMLCCFTWLSLLPKHNTGFFVSYNCDTGRQAMGGFEKAFMDHYYPPPEIPELKPAKPVPDRVARCAGEYSSLRRSFTSLTKLAAITGTMNVWVDPEGYLLAAGAGGAPKRWVEVAPLLFREAKGQGRMAFRADEAGNITHLFPGPASAFVKLRWYETPAFHNAVANFSLVVMLSALVMWPIMGFCLRGRRGPESPPRSARLLAWIMCLNLLLVFYYIFQVGADTDFGVSAFVKSALWLPLLAIPLFAATAWFSVRAWTRKYWSLAGRLHYSLVTVAGLTLLGWLYYWNLLGFHYS